MKKLFIIFAVLCLAAPAMAADWNFYGSARMATFVVDVDPDVPGVDSDTDLQWAQQGNSRIGATVKFNDEIGGGFEMSDSFGKRKLYGTYNFGAGQLLLGQTYTPLDVFYSDSVFDGDGDLLGVGSFYEGRLPMIQWKMGGLKIALITPNTTGATIDADYLLTVDDANAYSQLPKIEANYKFSGDTFFFNVGAGYNSLNFEWVTDTGVKSDESIDSYVVALGGGLNLGAFYANLAGHMGQNLGNYGAYNPMNGSWDRDRNDTIGIDATGKLVDNDGYGMLAVLGFKVSEMFNIEAGYGFQSYEFDIDGAEADETTQYYLNATINIAPGFFIVPEVGMIDFDTDPENNEQGEVTYFGAKWQINF
jgi:hypothetical protein